MTTAVDQVLGYGLLQPFRWDGRSDFAASGGIDLIRSNVAQVLGTFCGSENGELQGELPWRPEVGSRFQLLRHRNNDATLQALARTWAIESLARWEPRVRVRDVRCTDRYQGGNVGRNVVVIQVVYDILARPRSGSPVLVQGVFQEVLLAA